MSLKLKEQLNNKKKLFFPVIHCVSGDCIDHSLKVAYEASADGVIFIDQGDLSAREIIEDIIPYTRKNYNDLFIGLNILGDHWTALEAQPDIVWTDSSGILNPKVQNFPVLPPSKYRGDSLWFGGVAFKYQYPIIKKEDWQSLATEAAKHMDVVMTSGNETGCPIDPEKAMTFRKGLGEYPLGVASGVAIENVKLILPYVDVFFVASSIEKSFGTLDLEKTKKLSSLIHYYNHDEK